MKKYIKPQISVYIFDCVDIVTTSFSSTGPNAQGGFLSGWLDSNTSSDASGSGIFKNAWWLGE